MPAFAKTPHYDAVVVGARCAGASTAMLLARQGAKVLVVDHDRPGTDTMSTHALMRGAVMQLDRWGMLDGILATDVQPIRRTSFYYGAETIDVDIRPAHGTEALYAPRRKVLDSALASAAQDAGASFRYGVGCSGLIHADDGRVTGVRLKSASGEPEAVAADIVIGADGRRSSVARHAGAEVLRRSANASAAVYGYFYGLPNRGYRWYWEHEMAGGIIPTNGAQSCVFLSMPYERFIAELRGKGYAGFQTAMASHLPALAGDMAGARLTGHLVAFQGEQGYVRQSHGPGWALVGDAAYFKDPLTAHGITDAFRDAEILADAVLAGRPGDYPPIRDALSGEFFRLTDQIAAFDWTMDELKEMHAGINRAMKIGQNWIAENFREMPRAA